jgi:hypothetical protein
MLFAALHGISQGDLLKWLKESEAISETAAKATETITAFHTKSRLFLSLGHGRNKNKWGRFIPSCRWNGPFGLC